MRLILRLISIVLLLTCCGAAQTLDQIWQRVDQSSNSPNGLSLSNDKIASGLREALAKGATAAVNSTGRLDGYYRNPAIKILLPNSVQSAARGMRMIGMGQQLDDFELAMNRAAEQAAPAAKQIFIKAISRMTIDDARKILSGNDTAATDYFKRTATDDLTQAFAPIVHRSMENVGVVQQYDQLKQNAIAAPLLANSNFDIDRYVVGKALDGLFYMVGQEEKQIRTNPAAQTTNILREVFGKIR